MVFLVLNPLMCLKNVLLILISILYREVTRMFIEHENACRPMTIQIFFGRHTMAAIGLLLEGITLSKS
jgi:hypothetical protein